jgi:predicted outer membrane protein
MKTSKSISSAAILLLITLCSPVFSLGQANDPRASAKSSAQFDAQSISNNISNVSDVLYFTRMAIDRASERETMEIANEMVPDFTGVLFAMEQLATAGGKGQANNTQQTPETQAFYQKLSSSRGFDFDTSWVSGMMVMLQSKYDDLLHQKENATNGQLTTAVKEAMPVFRKYNTRLTSLKKLIVKRDIQEKKEAARNKQK